MGTGTVDPENVSAYMVHHVLQQSKTNKKNEKRKTKKKKPVLSRQGNSNGGKHQKPLSKGQQVIVSSKKRSNRKKVHKSEQTVGKMPNMKNSSPGGISSTCSTASIIPTPLAPSNTSFDRNFESKTLFQWMIQPVKVNHFMNNFWEKKPLHIPNSCNEFSVLVSTPVIDDLLTYSNIQYTKNLDITFYNTGIKETHNMEGRARPHVVWDYYCNGCSVRLLNPQTFVPNILKLTSELQEYFGCFVGCNAYLTPPHSQGFAPHYDDIEAFILQIEGKKRWRVYEPRTTNETLPRFSSIDFTDDNLPEPVMEVVLNAGDVLYLPRGYIHQASTEQNYHSLHITVSAYQCNAWIDLLQKVVPKAMENAWKKDIEFRKGLPLDYLHAAGLCKDRKHKSSRVALESNLKTLICKLADHMQIDSAVDQFAAKLLYDALPPVFTEEEKQCSVYGGGMRMVENGHVVGATDFEFDENVQVCLLRKFVSRLVKEVTEVGPQKKRKIEYRLYYTTDNSLEYHGEQTSFSIVPKHFVPCIQYLFQTYPQFITVNELPYDDTEEKINLVADLWERGIVRTKVPIMKPEQCKCP